MATKSRAPKKSTIAVDFSETETQQTIEEGDYVLTVDEVEQKTSENSGSDYLAITFKVAEGTFKGKKVYHNCSLQPQALFNLRGLLEALGFDVPQGRMDLDPADMIGESCGASIAHETYQGKTKARPVEFFPADQVGEESSPAPQPAAKVVKAAKVTKPEPVEEPEAEEEPEEKPVTRSKKKKAVGLSVGDKVTFTDDEGNDREGSISAIEDGAYTVITGVGKKAEEWELEESDLTAA